MSDNVWLQRARKNLLPLSENKKDFYEAKKEWVYIGLFDNDDADFDCQLCGHKEIRYEYTIQNELNKNEMIVGSSCITKFVDYMSETNEYLVDSTGITVTVQRLEDDKYDYWKKILFEALDFRFSGNDFKRSITSQIKEDGKLTIKQAKCLRIFYSNLNQNEQTAFRSIVSIKLARTKHKDQYEDLSDSEKPFISKLLSSQQRHRMEKIYGD